MDRLGLSHQDRLARHLAEARRAVTDLAAELAAVIEAAAAAPPDDEHDAEGATVGFERARLAALLDHARRRVADLEAAAARAEAGKYGFCAGCGRPIDPERLAARPTTDNCVECAGPRRSGPTLRSS